ncbi:MAG: hypothetical protein ABSE81_05300 [Candidatus Omnitrophota bacterium]
MDIRDWCSWVKEMLGMLIHEFWSELILFIIAIYSLFKQTALPKFVSWLFVILSGFCLIFIMPYKKGKKDRDELKKLKQDTDELKNRLNELQPLVDLEKQKQEIIPLKKELQIIVDKFSGYIIPNRGNNYNFEKFINSIKFEAPLSKDCLNAKSNFIEKWYKHYSVGFEESFNLPMLMNELNEFGFIIQDIFEYLKDNKNSIKDFDKQQYSAFKDIYTLVKNGYLALREKIPDKIKKNINIISFVDLPNFEN